MEAPVVSDFTFVLAAKGSGFAGLAEPGNGLFVAVLGGPRVPRLTAVVAASGFGFKGSLSGALWLPIGLSPTPDVLVLPSGLGCIGDEQKLCCQPAA